VSRREVTFTKEQIAAYADASGDHNPIHLDGDFARTVGLPGIIAHGMFQMGLMATVAADAAGGPEKLRRLYCRFAGMVVPGDTVTFTAEPLAQGKLDLRAVNQRGEPVLTKSVAEYD
jgi:acyl dehydratase